MLALHIGAANFCCVLAGIKGTGPAACKLELTQSLPLVSAASFTAVAICCVLLLPERRNPLRPLVTSALLRHDWILRGTHACMGVALHHAPHVLYAALTALAAAGLDALNLFYITMLGSAASYGVFFYNAARGNLTALSSLTFLTPMFAAGTGFLLLGETLTPLQARNNAGLLLISVLMAALALALMPDF